LVERGVDRCQQRGRHPGEVAKSPLAEAHPKKKALQREASSPRGKKELGDSPPKRSTFPYTLSNPRESLPCGAAWRILVEGLRRLDFGVVLQSVGGFGAYPLPTSPARKCPTQAQRGEGENEQPASVRREAPLKYRTRSVSYRKGEEVSATPPGEWLPCTKRTRLRDGRFRSVRTAHGYYPATDTNMPAQLAWQGYPRTKDGCCWSGAPASARRFSVTACS